MRIIAVVPARFGSSRFPGKPLIKISGKTMIERVYFQALKAKCFEDVLVATDDERIYNEVKRFGGNALITSAKINSGSERVWSVLSETGYDSVVNIQGDEPLISEILLKDIHRTLSEGNCNLVTAAYKNSNQMDFLSTKVVKVLIDVNFNAIYFSRSPLPYHKKGDFQFFFHHIGIYGYTRDVLNFFISSPKTYLEESENLEQLRFIENGKKIKVLITPFFSPSVDIPSDVSIVEMLLKEKDG